MRKGAPPSVPETAMPRVERCPSCDEIVPVPDQFVSGQLRCRHCQSVFRVPELDEEDERSERRFSEGPAETPRLARRRDDDLDDDDEPWLHLRHHERRAAARVQGPGILLLIFGVLMILGAVGAWAGG